MAHKKYNNDQHQDNCWFFSSFCDMYFTSFISPQVWQISWTSRCIFIHLVNKKYKDIVLQNFYCVNKSLTHKSIAKIMIIIPPSWLNLEGSFCGLTLVYWVYWVYLLDMFLLSYFFCIWVFWCTYTFTLWNRKNNAYCICNELSCKNSIQSQSTKKLRNIFFCIFAVSIYIHMQLH